MNGWKTFQKKKCNRARWARFVFKDEENKALKRWGRQIAFISTTAKNTHINKAALHQQYSQEPCYRHDNDPGNTSPDKKSNECVAHARTPKNHQWQDATERVEKNEVIRQGLRKSQRNLSKRDVPATLNNVHKLASIIPLIQRQ